LQYLAVLFQSGNPTTGAYNQLPSQVLFINGPNGAPADGNPWVIMTVPALNDYVERVRLNAEPNPLNNPIALASAKVAKAIQFGQGLILQAAAENIVLGLTSTQIIDMVQKCSGVMSLLESGALGTALVALEVLVPDSVVTQPRINNFITQIQQYIRANP
jgi:hypothetical protein